MKEKILIVDDEADILTLLEYNLEKAGFKVISANDGPDAVEITKREKPDIIILDIMLPSMEGTEVCKILKSGDATRHIPIIMLTAKGEEVDRIVGFELGADDYITKPFSPRELILRVKAVLKRGQEQGAKIINAGPITIDVERSLATADGKVLKLTAIEFKLLLELAKSDGKVLSRDTLLDRAWGTEVYITDRTVDTHIRRLREKLGKTSKYIETVRGFGYRFREE
ncbi:MAG: DNA-binding response regulator [Deltaproteobacteria bacterium RIFCSPLOWO2_02_44_9]|nr:MAG: DNA-binding response regulator [Deltaproteobacteria bacterium RIFCSPLOWO2_02_44_9]